MEIQPVDVFPHQFIVIACEIFCLNGPVFMCIAAIERQVAVYPAPPTTSPKHYKLLQVQCFHMIDSISISTVSNDSNASNSKRKIFLCISIVTLTLSSSSFPLQFQMSFSSTFISLDSFFICFLFHFASILLSHCHSAVILCSFSIFLLLPLLLHHSNVGSIVTLYVACMTIMLCSVCSRQRMKI